MNHYYYIINSLPVLLIDKKPPFTIENFLANIQHLINQQTYNDLIFLINNKIELCKNKHCLIWHKLDLTIRQAIAKNRANKIKIALSEHLYPNIIEYNNNAYIDRYIEEAFCKANPLEREKAIDLCRWHLLDEIAALQPFGFAALMSFVIKLQIISRWSLLNESEGLENINKTKNNLINFL